VARFALGRPVAFEVDQIDEFLHNGWSVLVVGRLREMTFSEVQQLEPGRTPQPWAQGQRTLVCQVELGHVTGRRVHPG
jgi:pyridoxamine 5'-phosphate oxidase-like protein